MSARKFRVVKPAVYHISNPETGEYYIGATGDINKRQKEHLAELTSTKGHRNRRLQETFNKGVQLDIAVFPVDTVKLAFMVERELVAKAKQDSKCLNIRGAYEPAMLGRKMSEEQRHKQSERMKARCSEPGYVSPMKGKKMSDASKELMRESKRQLYEAGYVNPFTGKTHSEEFSKRQSELANSLWADPAFREARSNEGKQRFNDPAFREIHQKKVKDGLADPVVRARLSAIGKERTSSPEWKHQASERQSERMKNPDARELSRQGAIKQWQTTDIKDKLSALQKAKMADPVERDKLRAMATERMKDPAVREALREAGKKQWEDPEHRKKMKELHEQRRSDPSYVHPRTTPVQINNVTYPSVKDAANALGMSLATFHRKYRAKKDNQDG